MNYGMLFLRNFFHMKRAIIIYIILLNSTACIVTNINFKKWFT